MGIALMSMAARIIKYCPRGETLLRLIKMGKLIKYELMHERHVAARRVIGHLCCLMCK